jgi:hypothetical protein
MSFQALHGGFAASSLRPERWSSASIIQKISPEAALQFNPTALL